VATKAICGKPVQTVVVMVHVQLTRTEKMAFHEKYYVLMNHSENHKNLSCTSSRILAITREVENGFRKNASSPSLSYEK